MSFGVTQVGDAPVLQTVTLRNEGNAPLTSIELGTTGVDFALEHNGCGGALPLAMGQTCQLQLAFRPTRAGNFSAGLRIAGAGLAAVLRLPLYGGATLGQGAAAGQPIAPALRRNRGPGQRAGVGDSEPRRRGHTRVEPGTERTRGHRICRRATHHLPAGKPARTGRRLHHRAALRTCHRRPARGARASAD
ncbi:MAG: choice-of-anchor D domain-containing protein [Betaproteobacteria bacterium]|nr:choice-of-anchor D domain-containing protein [Betaproteobacteria bacterium]